VTGPTIGDRYRLARRLGQGGMSRVYLCWDERLHLWCSIKVMSAEVVDDAVLRARFVQEARTLARLGHENLVRLYELVDHVACPYMVMEYVEGGTLAERMARGPLHLHHAIALVAQTCSALHAAHQAGVIHRDIKPQNLLLAADGTLKVGDFGVARVQQEMRLTMSNMSLGTLA
jgi:serine/threonine protein kinase